MRVPRVPLAALALSTAACGGGTSSPTPVASTTPSPPAQELRADGVTVAFQPNDASWAPIVHAEGIAGRENAARFFGAPPLAEVHIDVLPDRAAINAHWRRIYQQPGFQSECWMIASGDANGIALLSPGAWARDSCGHDGQDALHRSRVTYHEVVHVHHARANPSWAATVQSMHWFVEGVAVHASGQYDDGQRAIVRDQVLAGRGPLRLAEVLPAGYDWAGSLAAFIDRRYGRATLAGLLLETQEASLLRRLGATEADLVAAWRADIAASP